MIKIFGPNDTDFSTMGNAVIEPISCIETKRKSLNGWNIKCEVSIKYKEFIIKDNLVVLKTKSKLNPQAFFIEEIEYTTRTIIFTANHIAFKSDNYFLLDVRPTNLGGLATLIYINERTDKISPFQVYSNITTLSTSYFIRKSLLEAWKIIEEKTGGTFDLDNFNISLMDTVGNDNGEIISYGNNLEGFNVYEDWSAVTTRLYPVGKDGLLLPERFIDSDIQYQQPYTRTESFESSLEDEEQTEANLILELRTKANEYLNNNKYPKVTYEVQSNINQDFEIGDIIHVKHPIVNLSTEVLEYEYNHNTKRITNLIFGNYVRDVKQKFSNIKDEIASVITRVSAQKDVIDSQTKIINELNAFGKIIRTENEVLILDTLPIENAKNVWRWNLGGLGFSSNGYLGPYKNAWTIDGQFNADFITTGKLNTSVIEGYDNLVSIVNGTTTYTKTSDMTYLADKEYYSYNSATDDYEIVQGYEVGDEITGAIYELISLDDINSRIDDIKDAIGTLNSTILNQTSEQFEMLFAKTGIKTDVDNLSKLLDNNSSTIDQIVEYIRFKGASIELGKESSPVKLLITNDRISFMTGESESAYISNNQLYITDSTILNKLQVGHWETKEDIYGNLNTRWVND